MTDRARYERRDWYDAPQYYDMVFDEGTDLEADFLEAAFERFHALRRPPKTRKVLEPACGTGRLLGALAGRGWQAVGFDASRPMLDYASARLHSHGLKAKLREGRMEQFELGRGFHLAHCLVSTFKYLDSEAAAKSHLECVARSLAPGGIYVLGFHLTDYAERSQSRERWVVERDDCKVVCNITGWPAERAQRAERIRSRLRVEEGGERFAFETEWSFRTYDGPQAERLLRSVPAFELAGLFDFTYDLEDPRTLDDGYLDKVFVLRARP